MRYWLILLMLGATVLGTTGCASFRRMYFPKHYDSSFTRSLTDTCVALKFQTAAGSQEAFYIAPSTAPGQPPEHLWYMFGGNASLALGWMQLVNTLRRERTGFLLFEYPGFGHCQGQPTMKSIGDSAEGALAALAGHLEVPRDYFEERMSLLGHSLGCATALQLASRHRIERIVLLAPFTSMNDMARRYVGWPLCMFVPDRFDNAARLAELNRRQPRPAMVIIHGRKDRVVPVWMSRKLAEYYPGWIVYHEIPDGTHNSFLHEHVGMIARAMFPGDGSLAASRF